MKSGFYITQLLTLCNASLEAAILNIEMFARYRGKRIIDLEGADMFLEDTFDFPLYAFFQASTSSSM